MAWEFISAIYDSGWDALYINNNMSFRNKVISKFTLKINNNIQKNKSSKKTKKLASVSSLSPLIQVKLPKEVRDIMKYFKKIDNPSQKNSKKVIYSGIVTW